MKISQNRRKRAAFTLAEVTMALAVIGTMGAGCYVGFNSLNQYAVSSRLYTEAQTCAQNQIDLALSKGPFDPTATSPKVPTVLGGGTCQCQTVQVGTPVQITTPNVFVYTDPVSGNVVVSGTMTTTVTNPGLTMTYPTGSTAVNLNTWRVTVTVSYTYRNTPYTVTMDTMRTADK
jgi:type II secretory pathway pseudopilin PulG